jgi:hypothetical protein
VVLDPLRSAHVSSLTVPPAPSLDAERVVEAANSTYSQPQGAPYRQHQTSRE